MVDFEKMKIELLELIMKAYEIGKKTGYNEGFKDGKEAIEENLRSVKEAERESYD